MLATPLPASSARTSASRAAASAGKEAWIKRCRGAHTAAWWQKTERQSGQDEGEKLFIARCAHQKQAACAQGEAMVGLYISSRQTGQVKASKGRGGGAGLGSGAVAGSGSAISDTLPSCSVSGVRYVLK